jgi:hypothetical protein
MRVLDLLTPEFTPIPRAYLENAIILELQRAGLVETLWSPSAMVRLTANGRTWRPTVNN